MISTRRVLPLLACLLLSLGCSSPSGDESCQLDGDCEREGVVGQCVEGYCAFEDNDCDNGKWVAGPNAGQCVPGSGEQGDDGGGADGATESSSGDSSAEGEESETGPLEDMAPPASCQDDIEVSGFIFRHIATLDVGAAAIAAVPQQLEAARFGLVGSDHVSIFEYADGAGEIVEIERYGFPPNLLEEPRIQAADLFEDGHVDFSVVGSGGTALVRWTGMSEEYELLSLVFMGGDQPAHAALIPGDTPGRNFMYTYSNVGDRTVFADLDGMPTVQTPYGENLFNPTAIEGHRCTEGIIGGMVAQGETLWAILSSKTIGLACCAASTNSVDLESTIRRLLPSAVRGVVLVRLAGGELFEARFANNGPQLQPQPLPPGLGPLTALALDDMPDPTQALAAATAGGIWVSDPMPDVGEVSAANTLCLDEDIEELTSASSLDGSIVLAARTESGRVEVFVGRP